MIEGFDKEIDSLLRRTAAGESVGTFAAHLDADEISLFAENALATKARGRAVSHLADCAKCRKILSNVISFNAAAESETIHAEESTLIPLVPAIPWYRKLFAFPQITFAMGALALVFAGIMAVMVLQTARDSQNVSVAQRENVSEISKGTSGASSDGEAQTVETYSSNSPTNMSNSASVNPGITGNFNRTTANTSSNTVTMSADTTANVALPAVRQQPQTAYNEPLAKPGKENEALPEVQKSPNATLNSPSVAGVRPADDVTVTSESSRRRAETKDNQERDRKLENAQGSVSTAPKSALKKSTSADKNKAGESQTVGGKTFRNLGGIWFDSAYTSQQPILIRRGSDDYRRLDSGLRSIAESLSGTVVVVWKSKAYRIH